MVVVGLGGEGQTGSTDVGRESVLGGAAGRNKCERGFQARKDEGTVLRGCGHSQLLCGDVCVLVGYLVLGCALLHRGDLYIVLETSNAVNLAL